MVKVSRFGVEEVPLPLEAATATAGPRGGRRASVGVGAAARRRDVVVVVVVVATCAVVVTEKEQARARRTARPPGTPQ
jgi:hypothetical protein